ncbi:TPA: glycosyltransferase family 4 protein [Citrobacter freundii]
MKICHIIPSNAYCSPVLLALKIAESTASDKDESIVYYLKEASGKSIESKTIVLKKFDLSDFLDLRHFDIIHSHLLRADIINAICACMTNATTISTIHSNIKEDLRTYIKNNYLTYIISKIWFISLNKLTHRVAVSKSLAESYKSTLKSCEFIPNGIDNEIVENSNSRKQKEQRFSVGFLSRLHPGKGIEDAFELAKKSTEVDVYVYGDGVLSELCEQYNEKYDNFHYKGYSSNITKSFQSFDIFIMPSRHEGFGMTVLESLVHQVPVICYDIPVFREILGNGDYFYNTVDELYEKINAYKNNYTDILAQQNDRLHYFDEKIMIERYSALYNLKKKKYIK